MRRCSSSSRCRSDSPQLRGQFRCPYPPKSSGDVVGLVVAEMAEEVKAFIDHKCWPIEWVTSELACVQGERIEKVAGDFGVSRARCFVFQPIAAYG